MDPEGEIETGEFEHGGTMLLKSYWDESGKKNVGRSKVSLVKIAEIDRTGKALWKEVKKLDVN